MNIDAALANILPTPAETLLLKAALFRGDIALEAWSAWKTAACDTSTQTARQVQPLLYRNLSAQGVRDERLADIRPAYLETWAVNRGVVADAGAALAQLEQAGIATLVFKGAALGPVYYRDAGARPIGDVDILVPETRVAEALAALHAAELVPRIPLDRLDVSLLYGANFDRADGRAVADLHWHILAADRAPGSDRRYWDASVPVRISGFDTRTLCVTDHLIVACVHGLVFKAPKDVRWIADAITLIGSSAGGIDWDRVIAIGTERGLAIQLAAALRYLHEGFEQPVPREAIARLERARTSVAARMFARMTWSPKPRADLPRPVYQWMMLAKTASPDGSVSWMRALVRLVRQRYRARGPWRATIAVAAAVLRVPRSLLRVLRFTIGHARKS